MGTVVTVLLVIVALMLLSTAGGLTMQMGWRFLGPGASWQDALKAGVIIVGIALLILYSLSESANRR